MEATKIQTTQSPQSPVPQRKRPRKRSSKSDFGGDSQKPKIVHFAITVAPGDYHEPDYYYPRVLNAQVHPMVASFMRLTNERIALRYCHLHPKVKFEDLLEVLSACPKHFRWAGADLFVVTTPEGKRQMIVIETNSCPSGQKSMPALSDEPGNDGYHMLMRQFFTSLQEDEKMEGDLAVVYDKNYQESEGYAAALADVSGEKVWQVKFFDHDKDPPVRFNADNVMEVRDEHDKWHPIRAAFRYVTQRPWTRIPIVCKTRILNKIVSCLAGGRNKLMASKAYESYNSETMGKHLPIRFPHTIRDVPKGAVPMWVESMGGMAVVKNPYSNAGQGVYCITSKKDLDDFMQLEAQYDKFIVQHLVGNSKWSSVTKRGTYYHCGTIPDPKLKSYIFDLRMMVGASKSGGFRPMAVYARQALKPLVDDPADITNSWDMLGTNLSIKKADGEWDSDTRRLCLMDRKDFNRLGLGVDDLIDAYVQTVLSVMAIDGMACKLLPEEEGAAFNYDLFKSMNEDDAFLAEMGAEMGGMDKL